MELWIWVAYIAGFFWFPGWLIMVPVGTIVYSYNFVDGLYHLVLVLLGESKGSIEEWVQGPLERMFVGPLILVANFWMASVPVLNIVSSFLLGWLAQLDYYGYNYKLGFGPQLPEESTEDEDADDKKSKSSTKRKTNYVV